MEMEIGGPMAARGRRVDWVIINETEAEEKRAKRENHKKTKFDMNVKVNGDGR